MATQSDNTRQRGDTTPAPGSAEAAKLAQERMDKLFRREGIVSDADLRIDVAKEISRVIMDDESVELDTKSTHVRGNLSLARGELDQQVAGAYSSKLHGDTRMISDNVKEVVNGGVHLNAQLESETLMAGAYVNTLTGPYLRLCAWADFLAWGGWVEADLVRMEIAGVMLRAYWFYAHAAVIRMTRALILIDDFEKRFETFGFFMDQHMTALEVGSPGSGDTLEA